MTFYSSLLECWHNAMSELICDKCGCEFPSDQSMPHPETDLGDYCFECHLENEDEWNFAKGKTWLEERLPSLDEFMVAYKNFAKGKSLDPRSMENNCCAAANALFQLMKGKLDIKTERGHWLGKDARGNGRGLQQHSWTSVRVPDNDIRFIIDPTQWVFTGKEPGLYICDADDNRYDIGGYKMKAALNGHKPFPERKGKVSKSGLSTKAKDWLKDQADRDWSEWSIEELFFLANMDPRNMGGFGKEIFQAIIKGGNKGFIPLEGLDLVEL